MMFLQQQIICPFCFSRFSGQEMLFRCVSVGCKGVALDDKYAQERGLPPLPMGHILTPPKSTFSVARSMECDVCRRESRTRLCPACHYQLPYTIDQVEQRVVAIIGGSNTGKSHYITSLVHTLMHEVGANFRFSLKMEGDETRRRWNDDFYKPLYENKNVLQATQRSSLDSRVKTPLIIRLSFDLGKRNRDLYLSFFDTAGEDMTRLEVDALSVEARYISQADGVIFLLDPLQIDSVRQQLPSVPVPPADIQAKPEYIVARFHELLESRLNIKPGKKVKTPVAFTLSKVDTLRPIVSPDSALLRRSEHFGQVDLDDIQSMHTELENYLGVWINANFCEYIQHNFEHYRYFGVSSLGSQPANGHIEPHSVRVEDPFLWLLYQLGLVKAKKGR